MITPFTVGISAYNEEANITKLIDSILHQQLPTNLQLREIIIVSSGSTDKTNRLVLKLSKKERKLKLIKQNRRFGKASAVNILLKKANTSYIVLMSADILFGSTFCLKRLISALKKKNVGLVGGKIVPLNSTQTFSGNIVHTLWELHDLISRKYPRQPKLGELIAFKKIFNRIPPSTSVDEASIEPLVRMQGYRSVYLSNVIIYNHGPVTIREYLSQRRHYYAGHYFQSQHYNYRVSTLSLTHILSTSLTYLFDRPTKFPIFICIALLEIIARTTGWFDNFLGVRSHTIWKIAPSTKNLSPHE